MLRPRIMPCLLLRDKGLVKTIGFTEPKYVGDPINAVKIFNEKGVDELIILDIDATVRGTEPDYQTIEKFASESRMPLCYGGGVRTTEQAKNIIRLGVEKVALSTAAINNPLLVAQVAEAVGNQSTVVVLDVKAQRGGSYQVWIRNGTVNTGRSVREIAIELENNGVGEIVLNSIDNDGRMKGYDMALIQDVWESVNVPLTVLGGAGTLADIGEVIKKFGVIGLAAGSMFVFKGVYRAVLINYPSTNEREELINNCLSLS